MDMHSSPIIEHSNPNLDRGWAWIIMFACFGMHYSVVSLIKAFGILTLDLQERFSSSMWAVTLVQGTASFLWSALAPVSNRLAVRYSTRIVVFVGGVIGTLGFIGSFASPNIYVFFISYGLIVGTGYGLVSSPSIVIMTHYFKDRLGLAVSVGQSGVGLGILTIPLLISYLIYTYSLSGCLLLLGTIMVHCCVYGMLMRPTGMSDHLKTCEYLKTEPITVNELTENALYAEVSTIDETIDTQTIPPTKIQRCYRGVNFLYRYFELNLLCDKTYLVYLVGGSISEALYTLSYIMLPALAFNMNFMKRGSYVPLIIGGSDMITRVLIGSISDFKIVKRKYVFTFTITSLGLVSLLAPITPHHQEAFVAICVLCGVFGSCNAVLVLLVLADEGKCSQLPTVYGFLYLFQGITTLIFAQIIGALYDATGYWNTSFYCIAICNLLCGIAMSIYHRVSSKS